jgi:hypothetical protein
LLRYALLRIRDGTEKSRKHYFEKTNSIFFVPYGPGPGIRSNLESAYNRDSLKLKNQDFEEIIINSLVAPPRFHRKKSKKIAKKSQFASQKFGQNR